MVTTDRAEAWAEAYRQAWENADSEAAAALFTEDGRYRDNIFEDPHEGRGGVEDYWRRVTEAQSDVAVRMGTPIVDGSRVMVEFWTTMLVGGEPLTLPGALILHFDENGLCTDLREYYVALPELRDSPEGWGG